MEASDPEIPGCFDINRGIGYCCSKRLASFWPSVHPASPRLDLKCSGTAETRSGLSPSLGGDKVQLPLLSACLSTGKRPLNRWSRGLQSPLRDRRRHRGMPRPLSYRHLSLRKSRMGKGKRKVLGLGKDLPGWLTLGL